jgi:DNA repair exonuclease SbcCD ATPase subunit
MIKIKNISMRNFLSTGNVLQTVDLSSSGLTLVLGHNADLGGDGARNGVGKSTLINAISYALYGNALSNIKKSNLINKTNGKAMFVSIQFEIDAIKYQIDRGRSPNIFRFLVNGDEMSSEESSDESQGENRNTQLEVDSILGLNHLMFKNIIAMNTYNEPFLSLKAAEQRQMIEHLLGITILSDKAKLLKVLVVSTKDNITEEEYRIKGIEQANEQIKKSITDLKRRQRAWIIQKSDKIENLTDDIARLNEFDIDGEIANHMLLAEYETYTRTYDKASAEISSLSRNISRERAKKQQAEKELEASTNNICYACGSELHTDNHTEILSSRQEIIDSANEQITQHENEIADLNVEISVLGPEPIKPKTVYKTAQDAYEKQNQISVLATNLQMTDESTDPYEGQIETLGTTGLQEISWDTINSLHVLKDHQEFLLKLLTNKDSFIRKRIIEQNLKYLNDRLSYYLSKLGLPHEVQFLSDLDVEITEFGRELDFDNLSRGERNRLILGLSWAFRDVHESFGQSIDFMAIDELLDSGLDTNGMESALSILKDMVRTRNKNIFFISHREELISRVSNILTVVKENGFTTFTFENEATMDTEE